MAQNTVSTAETSNGLALNGATTHQVTPSGRSARRQVAAPVTGQYVLPHFVRVTVAVSSAFLAVCGLVLLASGAIGSSGNFLQGLSGLNAVITGVMLLMTGGIGCMTFIASREKSIAGRRLLIGVVVLCHSSGAFAIQCAIISGQLVSFYQARPCEGVTETPSMTGMDTDEVIQSSCHYDSTVLILSSCILTFSILGFLLGVACSASCYFAAPRLLCCLCDMQATPATPHTTTNGQPATAAAAEEMEEILASDQTTNDV